MITLTELEDSASLEAIENGEYSKEITDSAPRVILILTQSWCPDWWAQKKVFRDLADNDDLKVYFLEYDKKAYRPEFTRFKETVYGNGLIPYLRFYRNGSLDKDSNYSGRRAIGKWLKEE